MPYVTIKQPPSNTVAILRGPPLQQPVLLAVSPNTGPIAGGTAVTLTGYGFTGAKSSSLLQPGFVVVNDTTITGVTVPGAVGVVSATVTNALYTSAPLANAFTYNAGLPIFSVDFTAIAVGGIAAGAGSGTAFEAATGMRLARASVATAQTSDRAFASVAADVARIGQPSASPLFRGLLFEETRTQLLATPRDLASWPNAGTATQTSNYAGGPDGNVNATRVQKSGGQFANYQLIPAAANGRYAWSAWVRATDGVSSFASSFGGGFGISFDEPVAVGPNWSRFTWADPGAIVIGNGVYTIPVWNDGGTYDELVDAAQYELGGFVTSFIASGTRAGEHLFVNTGSALISSGRLRLDLELIPLGGNGDYSFAMRLFTVDANNYAEISTGGVVTAVIGGVSCTFPAIAWNAYDVVQVFLEIGGGVTSSLTSSVNGATPTVNTTTALGSLVVPGAIDILCNGTGSQLSCLLQKVQAYP